MLLPYVTGGLNGISCTWALLSILGGWDSWIIDFFTSPWASSEIYEIGGETSGICLFCFSVEFEIIFFPVIASPVFTKRPKIRVPRIKAIIPPKIMLITKQNGQFYRSQMKSAI